MGAPSSRTSVAKKGAEADLGAPRVWFGKTSRDKAGGTKHLSAWIGIPASKALYQILYSRLLIAGSQ